MFSDNKYTKWYFSIVKKSIETPVEGYSERHHIIPKCMGGSNHPGNLVRLSARQHFICHWLLTKMVDNTNYKYKLWNAFSCMLYRENKHHARYKVTGRVFENIKKSGARIKSLKFSGAGNPQYGKKGPLSPIYGRKITAEHSTNMSLSRIGKKRSEESKEKQGRTTKGRKQTPEHVAKRKRSGDHNGMFGKKHSTETILKGIETRKQNKLQKKIDAILREGMVIYPESPEKKNANVLMLLRGVHPSQMLVSCLGCNKTVSKGMFGRWHEKCTLERE